VENPTSLRAVGQSTVTGFSIEHRIDPGADEPGSWKISVAGMFGRIVSRRVRSICFYVSSDSVATTGSVSTIL
jgi:hypothetical protein